VLRGLSRWGVELFHSCAQCRIRFRWISVRARVVGRRTVPAARAQMPMAAAAATIVFSPLLGRGPMGLPSAPMLRVIVCPAFAGVSVGEPSWTRWRLLI